MAGRPARTALRPHPGAESGFTLLETMFVVTIAAVLVAIAAPSFSQIMAKRRVTSAAQAVSASLRLAQAEATRRNRSVEWLMTTAAPDSANTVSANPVFPAAATGWMVRELGASSATQYIGGDATTRYGAITGAGTLRSIVFTPMGRMVDYTSGAPVIPSAIRYLRLSEASSGIRMCVYVSPGGGSRVCDPTAPSGTTTSCAPAVPAGWC